MNSTFAIFLDLLVIALMIATIVYAVSLNRSISKLRDGKAELATLLGNLAEAVAHADVAIKGMKTVANEYDTSLSRQIGTARALVDELGVMNETANNLAARIERAASNNRLPAPAAPVSPAPTARGPDPLVKLAVATLEADRRTPDAKARKPQVVQGGLQGGAERELIEAIELLRRSA